MKELARRPSEKSDKPFGATLRGGNTTKTFRPYVIEPQDDGTFRLAQLAFVAGEWIVLFHLGEYPTEVAAEVAARQIIFAEPTRSEEYLWSQFARKIEASK